MNAGSLSISLPHTLLDPQAGHARDASSGSLTQALQAIHRLALRLAQAPSRQEIAEIAVAEAASLIGGGRAALHAYQPPHHLTMLAGIGLSLPVVQSLTTVSLGQGACGRAAEPYAGRPGLAPGSGSGEAAVVVSPHDPELDLACWSLPLLGVGAELLGTLTLYPPPRRRPSADEEALFRIVAQQTAMAFDRAELDDRSQDLYRATVTSLVAAVDAKDPFTHNHSWQVAAYSRVIAEAMGLPTDEVALIELAGLLHDVGKIGIPDRVLQKANELTADEWTMMRRHPEFGANILGDNPALAPVVPLVRHHHERYDGRGYPDGLTGNAIPLGAAIVGLADAFDTMTSNRPYRRGGTVQAAISEVERNSGTHFHPDAVTAFRLALSTGLIKIDPGDPHRAGTTRELRLKRIIGVEARAFGLLQRISAEVGMLVDIQRFLTQLTGLIELEFPGATCTLHLRDSETGGLLSPTTERPAARRGSGVPTLPPGEGIVAWVAEHGRSQCVARLLEDERYVPETHRLLQSELAVPLLGDGQVIGVVDLKHPEPDAFSPMDQQVLEIVASYVAQALEVANLHQRLRRQADLDSLTGLLNHGAFYRQLTQELERARQSGGRFALAIIDIDAFKAINDQAGHLAGDRIIHRVGQVIAAQLRRGDAVARYGGDEFAIIMPGVTERTLGLRLLAIARELREQAEPGPDVSLSWGLASFPADGAEAQALVAMADARMYAMKRDRARRAGA